MAHDLAIDVDETSRFLEDLRLRREPLPDRTNIDAVAIRDLQTVMSGLGLDPICAEDAYQVIVRRIAAASTQRPDAAAARIQRLAGLMRDVASRTGPSLDQHYVAIEDLRRLVAEIGTAVSRDLAPKSDPLFVGRVPESSPWHPATLHLLMRRISGAAH